MTGGDVANQRSVFPNAKQTNPKNAQTIEFIGYFDDLRLDSFRLQSKGPLELMNDEHSEDLPKTQPEFVLIPPWPPKHTAQDLEDNGEPFLITVSFMERLRLPDKSWSSVPIATFIFDASRAKQEDAPLTRPDGSTISVIAGYSPENGGLLTVLLRQAEGVLGTLSCIGSYRVQSIIWISPENSIIISVSEKRK